MADFSKNLNAVEQELQAIYHLYAGLARSMDREHGLGGKLLYVGEPNQHALRLLRAANIAGAASLAVSADSAALRNAMREGAIDFVVNSLGEALRILKNEIRRKQPVAVGVAAAPQAILQEMADRGVQPDLLAPLSADVPRAPQIAGFLDRGAHGVAPQQPLPPGQQFNLIAIPPDWKQSASAFDELLMECMDPDDYVNRRWLRVGPRYLPASARRMRLLACSTDAAAGLLARLADARSRT